MSIAGPCAHCGLELATHTCPRCGAPVCDAHFDRRRRCCVDCAGGVGADADADFDLGG